MENSITWPDEVKNFIKQTRKVGYRNWFLVDKPDASGAVTLQKEGVNTLLHVNVHDLIKNRVTFWIDLDQGIEEILTGKKRVVQEKPNLVGYKLNHDNGQPDEPADLVPLYRLSHTVKDAPNHYVGHIGFNPEKNEIFLVREDGKNFQAGKQFVSPGVDIERMIQTKDVRSVAQFLYNTEHNLDRLDYLAKCVSCSRVIRVTQVNGKLEAFGGKLELLIENEESEPLAS